jgi:integrase
LAQSGTKNISVFGTFDIDVYRTNAGLIFQEPKTENSIRTVGIPGFIIKELQAHFERQDEKKNVLGSSFKDNDLAFCADDGSPLDPRSFTRFFERLVKKAGLPKIAFHDLSYPNLNKIQTFLIKS